MAIQGAGLQLLAHTFALSPTLSVTQPPSPSTAPWWGTALIAGAFVIVGGAISALSGWWADERRHKRELSRRWDDDLRKHAADFLADVDGYVHHASALEVAEQLLSPKVSDTEYGRWQQARIDEADKAKTESFQSMLRNFELLIFIAPENLTRAARHLRTQVLISDKDLVENALATRLKIDEKRDILIDELRKALDLPPLN